MYSNELSNLSFSDLCTFLEFIELREYGGGERWHENGSREKLALRFYLAKVLVKRTPASDRVPDLYRAFAKQLQENDVVISLNWDGLLEAAMDAVGKPYAYGRSNKPAVWISKLHGSVNWLLGEPKLWRRNASALSWVPIDFGSGMMERTIYYSPDLLTQATWEGWQPLGEIDPYLVLPGYGKAFDVRANAPLWYKPDWWFAFTHNVYVIGLSLAPDDFFVRSLFLSTLPYIGGVTGVTGRKIVIINPAPSVQDDYKFILGKEGVEWWNERFSIEHIERLRAT